MKHLLDLPSLSVLFLGGLALTACSGGGGGGGPCDSSPATTLAGDWHVTGTLLSLDPKVGDTYVPNGLDDAVLHLEFGAVEPQPGPNGTTVCSAAYLVTSATLDTHSPTGNPTSLFAGAVSNLPLVPEGVFTLSDTPFYFPTGDVSVTVDGIGELTKLSDSLFEYTVSFEVYAGQQVAAVVNDEPGIDDDGDGQIDEPDESEPGDGIDPDAELVCAGTMKLSFARGEAGLAAAGRATVGLEFQGQLTDADGAPAARATALLLAGESRVSFLIDGLAPRRAPVRIETAVLPDGRFETERLDGIVRLRLRGALAEDLVPEATLTLATVEGEQELRFVPVRGAGAKLATAQPAAR